MSKISICGIVVLLFCSEISAQAPSGFTYQAVVRNLSGELITNQTVGIQISLLQDSPNGTIVYEETFSSTTNSFGLVNLIVGSGIVVRGTFSAIDWKNGPYFIELGLDVSGGISYAVMGTSQLMSVPYALFAQSSASDGNDGKSAYQIWLDAGNTGSEEQFLASLIGTSTLQDISLEGSKLSISEGSTVDLSGIDIDTKLSESEVDEFTNNNGYLTEEMDGDPTNEIQDISLLGNELSISNGSTIDLSIIDTDTKLSESEVDEFANNNGYLTEEMDGDPTNEIQDISLLGNDLSISDGSTIDLSIIDTDTKLSESEVDEFANNNGYLTEEIDGDPTNEIQNISLLGYELSISNGSTIDLSIIDTDTKLSESEVDDFANNNGYLTEEMDGDPTNEIQDISGISINAEAIALNTVKVGFSDALVSANSDVIANSAKTGITEQQTSDIVANNAKISEAPGTISGQMKYWNGTAWVTIEPGSGGQFLVFNNGVPKWVDVVGANVFESNDVYNPVTGRVWMDRNLGASQVATSSTDADAYGDLYQWGRLTDGHEIRTSGTTTILSETDIPGHSDFIINGSTWEWRSSQNLDLWQGENSANNPCPGGYRIPTWGEWQAEIDTWESQTHIGAYSSPLKLPLAGTRNHSDGALSGVGLSGYYWSSTTQNPNYTYDFARLEFTYTAGSAQ